MSDYFDTGTSLSHSKQHLDDLFCNLYDVTPNFTKDVFLGLNLQWPKFDLPTTYNKYLLSFHTEYLHLTWVVSQAKQVYPKTITLITDYPISKSSLWPDNVHFVQWITMHKQCKKLQQLSGINTNIKIPKFKLSSLSNRITQYKNFVTAYLLKNFNHDEIILTYHLTLGKPEDQHGHPAGLKYLDELDFSLLKKTLINFDDGFSGDSPINNGNWLNSCYTDALVNLTNESFHYSNTVIDNQPYCWPGPYLTEKTLKPLLAGRPFLVVGQYQTYKFLTDLGLQTNFGFNTDFDNDPGDLTRIEKLFQTLEHINTTSINELFESSIDSATHNVKWIQSNNFYERCQRQNWSNVDPNDLTLL